MTKVEVKEVARRIFAMRVNLVEKPSQGEINQRRMAVRKRLEERRFNSMVAALRDELNEQTILSTNLRIALKV